MTFCIITESPSFSVALTTSTYSDEVDQRVVEVGTFGQEEAAPGTEVMEEEQILFLRENKQSVLII